MIQDRKAELRRELIARRKAIPLIEREEKEARIFEKVKPLLKSPVLCYVSTKYEVGTARIIQYCRDNSLVVAVPEVNGKSMTFGLTDPNGGTCITPALAFDENNYRIGYGGGYYDRFLRNYKGLSVGLCFKEFIMNIPVEDCDVPVDTVITD